MTVKTVDAHLGESAVLAVVLGAHTRLEVESLRQAGRLCNVEDLAANHAHQVGSQSALGLVTIGRNHHLVKTKIARAESEVQLLAGVVLDGYALALGGIPHIFRLYDKRALGQVLQKEVAGLVGSRAYGSALNLDYYVRQVFARLGILHVSVYVGISILYGFVRNVAFTGRGSNSSVVVRHNTLVVDSGCMSRK